VSGGGCFQPLNDPALRPTAAPAGRSYFFQENPVMFEALAPTSTGEARFLSATGISWEELEPLADTCSKVLVW
jgi:hypothetical protein